MCGKQHPAASQQIAIEEVRSSVQDSVLTSYRYFCMDFNML